MCVSNISLFYHLLFHTSFPYKKVVPRYNFGYDTPFMFFHLSQLQITSVLKSGNLGTLFSQRFSLNYCRGLEIVELKKEDIPMNYHYFGSMILLTFLHKK